MIKICPLINLITYFLLQINKRDHRKEKRSCTVAVLHRDSGHSNQKWWGYKSSWRAKSQLSLCPDRCRSCSTSLSLAPLSSLWGAPAACAPGQSLAEPLVCEQPGPVQSRIAAHQELAQGILPASSDETWRCFKRIHVFFKSWFIAESDCRKELTLSDVVSMNTTLVMLFFMQPISFN